ncbi:MAG: histone deacetylase [Spirochaetales bacterium]|nr:histone deacetylase [Spirochaetales bacterium]
MATATFYDPLFLEHDTGPGHPERAARLEAIVACLQRTSYHASLVKLPKREATLAEIGLVHDSQYIAQLESFCNQGGGYLDGDTPVSQNSYAAAVLAAGAGPGAVDAIQKGDASNAFLMLRPPGHHSLRNRAMGFCLFNNVAITASYARSRGFERVAIVDWDVHHGNGTESIFYNDSSVYFISLHQYPCYPGTGARKDRGAGAGSGYTLNIPLAPGTGPAEYERHFAEEVLPALEEYAPDLILVSAGFDAHKSDPLASLELTTESFARLTEGLRTLSGSLCAGRIISFLEGGYHLQALAESVEAHVAVLAT